MRTWLLISLTTAFILVGCPDDDVQDDDTSQADDDTQDPDDLDGDGYTPDEGDCDDEDPDIHPDAEEDCDGIDNDCDGSVDEDHSDYDGDGIADCVDDACDAAAPTAEWYGIEPPCPWEGTPAADPWDIVVEWRFGDDRMYGSLVMPVIANLTDDNGDGLIDERDVPDIVVNTAGANEDDPDFFALHGDGSGVIFGLYDTTAEAGVAVADIDLDGLPEIVTVSITYDANAGAEVVAYRHDGSEEWRAEFFYCDWSAYAGLARHAYTDPTPTVADVDGDGVPEVVTQWAVFDGVTGNTEVLLDEYFDDWIEFVGSGVYFLPVVADLDRDGTWEILLENSVYAADGTPLWDAPTYPEDSRFIGSAIADVQGDAAAEVVTVGLTTAHLLASDGDLLSTFPEMHAGTHDDSRLPVIADFDGDGAVEVAIAGDFDVVVMETDGTVLWISEERNDSSGLAGCSAFDFDVDGAYELICTDEEDLRIYDGRTGDVLFLWSDHNSNTRHEYPVVADVDADGSAEIILACYDYFHPGAPCKGVAVLGHRDNAWPPAGPVWSVHDYTPLRIRPDGRVETELIAPWSVHNMFKARPPGDGRPDLIPILGETCLASCDHGPWEVNWGVANQGLVNVRDPVHVAVYAVEGETETLLAQLTVDEVEYGYQAPGEALSLTPEQWGEGIRIVVDDDGGGSHAVDECREDNNVLEIAAPSCP